MQDIPIVDPGAAQTIHKIFSESCPDVIVILGMTHTGYPNIACMNKGSWETPLGLIDVNEEVANAIISHSELIIEDNNAFEGFHARSDQNIEIQIPIIQYAAEKCTKKVTIVPIKIGAFIPSILREAAKSIADVIKKFRDKLDIVAIASSDLSHESPSKHGSVQNTVNFMNQTDLEIKEAAESLNEDKLWNVAYIPRPSVCGPQTMFTVICLAKFLGATKAENVKYYTSHDIMQDYSPSMIVGYLSAVFT